MNSNQTVAEQVLKEKSMLDSYAIKESETFDLPIIKHQVTLYYKARFSYDVLSQQVLRFLSASLEQLDQQELFILVGADSDSLESILQNLHQDGVIEIVDNNHLVLSDIGRISADDGYSPLKSTQQYFELYYESVTDYIVKNPVRYFDGTTKTHPIVQSESYKVDTCPHLQKDKVLALYAEIKGQDLQKGTKEFQLEHIAHQANSTEYMVNVQELKLYQRNKMGIVYALWNALNQKIIHLA